MGPIVFFDGVCNLCNNSVDFIIRRDPEAIFRFSSLQSTVAKELVAPEIKEKNLRSILLLKNGVVFQKSNAVLEIVRHLNGFWPIFYIFKVIPKFIRDALYNLVSNHRYRWFGKRNTCRVPTAEEKARFVEDFIDTSPV